MHVFFSTWNISKILLHGAMAQVVFVPEHASGVWAQDATNLRVIKRYEEKLLVLL